MPVDADQKQVRYVLIRAWSGGILRPSALSGLNLEIGNTPKHFESDLSPLEDSSSSPKTSRVQLVMI